MIDNKALKKNYSYFNYVVIVHRDGVLKYVSKDFGKKHSFHYSVLLEKAKKFRTYQEAKEFIDNCRISGVQRIAELSVSMNIR